MDKPYGTRSTSKKGRETQGGEQGTENNPDTSALNTGAQDQPTAGQPEQPRVTFADDGTPAQRESEASESRTPGAETSQSGNTLSTTPQGRGRGKKMTPTMKTPPLFPIRSSNYNSPTWTWP